MGLASLCIIVLEDIHDLVFAYVPNLQKFKISQLCFTVQRMGIYHTPKNWSKNGISICDGLEDKRLLTF